MDFLAIENASSSSSSIPPSSTPGCKYEYDVFLSFRGTDTRNNFTDHLYDRLKQVGIPTFRDDERLEQGTKIDSGLLRAIDESKIAVVVLSKQYASSSWCLIELAKIVDCMDKKKLTVLPVFHYVDPSDVRYQRGSFAEAFAEHENRFKDKIDDVKTWRAALTEVVNLSGWHLEDKRESELIEDIVTKILGKLTSTYSLFHKDLVGINSQMDELVNLLVMGSNEVRFLGIWAMGGTGKTTLAQVIYDRFHNHFEGSSFLANVSEKHRKYGLVSLRKQLLSDILIDRSTNIPDIQQGIDMIRRSLCHKKVLIILDDVDQYEQLKALAGERSWFGPGSRIIITTRDEHVLKCYSHNVAEAQIYEVKCLNNAQSLKLFSRKAFKKDYPPEGYVELCQKSVHYTKGVPLAVEVLGCSLQFCRSPNLWESALGRLKEKSERNILDVLQISFDFLEEREKSLFLNIACFFKAVEFKSRLTHILKRLYDKPEIHIDMLQKKSLITITREGFQMHDLLQNFGMEIARRRELGLEIARGRRESPEEVARRSRL